MHIGKKKGIGSDLCLFYIIDDPLPYLTGAVVRTALDLNLRGAHMGGKRGFDGLSYQGTLIVQTEMLEKHGGRENLCQGVGDVLACRLGP